MFKELYYWMFSYLRKVKTNDTPAFNAYLLFCLLQIFNIGTIATLINYFLKTEIAKNTAIYSALGLAFLIAVINRFLLYNKRESIFAKFEGNSQEKKTKGQIYFWLYVILSLIVFFVAVANLVTPKY